MPTDLVIGLVANVLGSDLDAWRAALAPHAPRALDPALALLGASALLCGAFAFAWRRSRPLAPEETAPAPLPVEASA